MNLVGFLAGMDFVLLLLYLVLARDADEALSALFYFLYVIFEFVSVFIVS